MLFQFYCTLHLLFFLHNKLDWGEWQFTTINQSQIHFYSFLFQQITITIILQAKNLTASMTSQSISFPMEVLLILPPDYCQICPHLLPLIMFLITEICFQRPPLTLRIKKYFTFLLPTSLTSTCTNKHLAIYISKPWTFHFPSALLSLEHIVSFSWTGLFQRHLLPLPLVNFNSPFLYYFTCSFAGKPFLILAPYSRHNIW